MVDTKFVEKVVVSTTAVPVSQDGSDDLAAQEAGVAKAKRDIKAAVWAIVGGVALPIIPMIAIGAALLYIIFHNRQELNPGYPEFYLTSNSKKGSVHGIKGAYTGYESWYGAGGTAAYLVNFPPTTITTIAGLASKIMPYLTTSIMSLVAFFAARMLIVNSQRGVGEHLPSPQQLTILITLLNGSGWGPMWDTCAHRFTTKKGLAHPLPMAFTFMFFITLLGFLIPAVDTWFGFATKATTIIYLENTSSTDPYYVRAGRELSKTGCPDGPGNFSATYGLEWMPCILDFDPTDIEPFPFLKQEDEASRLAAGYSTLNQIMNYTVDNITYHYLTTVGVSNGTDYRAKTTAVASQCTPRTSACLPGATWPYMYNDTIPYFNCSEAFLFNASFSGAAQTLDADEADDGDNQNPSVPMVGMAFSSDASFSRRIGAWGDALLSDELSGLFTTSLGGNATEAQLDAQLYANVASSGLVGSNWSYAYIQPQNPLYFGVWGTGYPTYNEIELDSSSSSSQSSDTADTGNTANPLLNDSQIYREEGTELTYWMLGCEVHVYDVQYTWVNGSVHTFDATPASADMAGLISAPFGLHLAQSSEALSTAASIASLEYTSDLLADTFAQQWSKAALALSISAFEQTDDIQQARLQLDLTRVPILPLYLYLALKALYILTVIALAIGAYCFTHPAETEVVKQQLSPKGLAEAHFNAPVVRQIQERIDAGRDPKDRKLTTPPATGEEIDPLSPELQSADAVPPALDDTIERRVGLVTTANGAWQFAVKANKTWHTIQPYVTEARKFEKTDGTFF